MHLRHLLLLALIVGPVHADDQLPPLDTDVVSVSRETLVQLLQDNLAMRARVSDMTDKLEQAVKDRSTCVEARST